ncbi:linear amide C-N hydrolase [Vibrio maritimus]|uniref:linear amide C-N hydrolase n=1 Tax=Vibrio maritimus TaxID=990268 RepID=UPI003735AB1E
MKKNLNTLAIAIAATASIASISTSTHACSRIIQNTGDLHGISIARSYDWGGSELQSIAHVQVTDTQRETKPVPEYKNAKSWTVKHNTVSFEEVKTFHNTTGEAVNTEGLSASMLYMHDSVEFIKDIKDDGTPAVHLSDIVPYIVENYATVDEAVKAFEEGEFQIAYKTGIAGHQHGFHVSIQDKSGDIALLQLNKGGEMVVHRGDVTTDLRVMANSPLQQDHRAYTATFDMNNAENLPGSISSRDRNVRGIYVTSNTDWTPQANADWIDVRGKMKAVFDFGNKVPQDVIDPTNNESYATWETFVYSLETGGITYYNEGYAGQLSFNIDDIAGMKQESCADIYQQGRKGGQIVWGSCQ